LVKGREAALEESMAIDRRLDSLRTTVEQFDPDSVLEIGDHLRHAGLRYTEMRGRLGHAAALHDGEKEMQIAQPQAAADLAVGIDFSSHTASCIKIDEKRGCPLSR